MSEVDAITRSRLRWWLRAEKAFGVGQVPVPVSEAAPNPYCGVRVKIAEGQVSAPIGENAPPVIREQERSIVASVPPAKPPLIPVPVHAPFAAAVLPREEKIVRLMQMDADEVKACTRCRLHATRTNTVFGEGDADAAIFFIGEGPGETEDQTGRPFVGRAGNLLDKMIAGMGLRREQVFIANIVKCRPPGNRVPGLDEVETCTPYLVRQLEIVRPKVIVTLGRPAATYMLNSKLSMGRLRGEWQNWRGIRLMPTFHPSYVLRVYTEEVRGAVWSDLQKVLVELGMPVPKKGS